MLRQAQLAARQHLEERLDLPHLLSDPQRGLFALPTPRRELRRASFHRLDEVSRELHVDIVFDAEARHDDRAALRFSRSLARPPHIVGNGEICPARLTTAYFVPS